MLLEDIDDLLNAFNSEDEYAGLLKHQDIFISYCIGSSAKIRFNDEILSNYEKLICGILGKNTMNCEWYEEIFEDVKREAIESQEKWSIMNIQEINKI